MLIDVSPYMFHLGSFGVRWYGFFMAVSMAAGIYFLVRRGRSLGLDEDALYNAALAAIVGGVVGARLMYVLTNPGFFAAHPGEIIRVDHGGLSIHGALLGGFGAAWWYARRSRLPFWAVADGAVPGICIGIMLVRIGNIFNQEVLGHPSAFWFGRQPAQIYGSLIGAILLWLYARKARQNPPTGFLFCHFFFWYSVLRFFEEMFRDNPLYLVHYVNPQLGIGFLTLTQIFTPLFLAGAYLGMRWRLRVGERLPAMGPKEDL